MDASTKTYLLIFNFFLFAFNAVGYTFNDAGKFHLQYNNSRVIHVVNAIVGRTSSNCRKEERCCPSPTDEVIEGTQQCVQYVMDRCKDGTYVM